MPEQQIVDIVETTPKKDDPSDVLAYERDTRFVEYIRLLSEHSMQRENLVDSHKVFTSIRSSYGW